MNFDKIEEYFKALIEKINEMFKKKELNGKKSMQDEIKMIDNELSKIYFDIMNSKEISLYKKELINQKIGLLNLKFENLNLDLKNISDIDDETFKIEKRKNHILMAIVTLLLIFLPPIGIIAMAGYSLYMVIHITKLINGINADVKKNKGVEEEIRTMMNTLHNCGVFLTKKHNIWLENQDKKTNDNLIESLEVRVANDLLQEYLNSGYYRKVPANIENYLIKMLQDDLQTEDAELESLMEMAKNKLSYENLNEELNLGVNLSKNIKK